jgi:putative endonuclease
MPFAAESSIHVSSVVKSESDKHQLSEGITFVYYVYILRSLKTKKLYIGQTGDLDRRLKEHNTGWGGRYTRQNGPWMLVYSEDHPNRASAVKRERYLKSSRGSQEKKKLVVVFV